MRTRLKRYVSGCALRAIARILQSMYFGVRFASSLMPALANNLPALDQYTANHGIRVRGKPTAFSQRQRASHERTILIGERGHPG
jgi:hypothetical protein